MLSPFEKLQPKSYMFTKKQLVAIMLPLILEQLLSLVVGMADSMMVGTVGDAAISGVSLVDAISSLMIYIFSAMGTGGAAVAGQYMGLRDGEKARSSGQQLIALMLVMSGAFTAALYIFREGILDLLFGSIEADVMAATNKYYLIVMASVPAIALFNGGAALFRAMERSDVSLKSSILMNVINVAGNAIMIFGMKMDVAGVAIPTLISRYVSALVLIVMLFNDKWLLHLSDIKSFRVRPQIMKNIFRISVPSGIENGMFMFGRLVLYSLISTFGTAQITANAIGNTFSTMHVCIGAGMNLGLVTVVSQCIGAGDFDQARYYVRRIAKDQYIYLFAANALFLLLVKPLMMIYNVDPEAERLAIIVSVIHSVGAIVLYVPAFMMPSFLRSSGDAVYAMLASIVSMWLFRVASAYYIGGTLGYGVVGVFFCHCALDWVVRSICFTWRYLSGKWRTKVIKA